MHQHRQEQAARAQIEHAEHKAHRRSKRHLRRIHVDQPEEQRRDRDSRPGTAAPTQHAADDGTAKTQLLGHRTQQRDGRNTERTAHEIAHSVLNKVGQAHPFGKDVERENDGKSPEKRPKKTAAAPREIHMHVAHDDQTAENQPQHTKDIDGQKRPGQTARRHIEHKASGQLAHKEDQHGIERRPKRAQKPSHRILHSPPLKTSGSTTCSTSESP